MQYSVTNPTRPEPADGALVYPQTPPSSRAATEAGIAWIAAWLNVAFALTALVASPLLGAIAFGVTLAGAAVITPAYVRRATPFSSAVLTVGGASVAVAVMIGLSDLPWGTGISWSQAGGVDQPNAWLFTTMSLCLGAGVLATGWLMAREGRRRGILDTRGHLFASVLPVLSCAGFLVLALCPVGGLPVLAAAHNIASWAALGAFWFGMVATPWLRGVARALRWFSAGAAVVVFGTWLPNGLRFMRLYEDRPVSMLAMELVVFPLCFLWFCWLAWEWSRD